MLDKALTEENLKKLLKRNGEILELVRAKGFSEKDPLYTEHQFLSPNQLEAAKLSKELEERGFRVNEIEPAEKEDGTDIWSVEVSIQISPEEAAAMTEGLVKLGAEYDSEYCGWAVDLR
ncbi:MAG TPA: ribonuclease E inhibitor RraB [Thermodesulfobacteriota bacterium]